VVNILQVFLVVQRRSS